MYKYHVDVRVDIVPGENINQMATAGCTNLENQDVLSNSGGKTQGISSKYPDKSQRVIKGQSDKAPAPLWSKIDLGSKQPPIFVDLNTLEGI